MAVNRGNSAKTAENNVNSGVNNAAQNNNGSTMGNGVTTESMFGFGLFMNSEANNEYVNKFTEVLSNVVPTEINKGNIKITNTVIKVDKTNVVFKGLGYSYVLVATSATDSDNVYIHSIMLEATGPSGKTVGRILEELNARRLEAYITPADAIEKISNKRYMALIADKLGVSIDKLVLTTGTIIPANAVPEEVAGRAGTVAYNSNVSKYTLATKKIPLIDASVISRSYNRIEMSIFHNTGLTINEVTRSVKTDYKIDVKGVKKEATGIRGLDDELEDFIDSSSGYLSFMSIMDNTVPNMPQKKIKPILVNNVSQGARLGTDFVLLSLVNNALFNNQSHMLSLLVNSTSDLGALNYFTNIANDKSGFGKPIDLKSTKLSDANRVELISKIFNLNPMLCVEVDLFAPGYDSLLPFAALNSMDKDAQKASRANEYIVGIAEAITNSQFTNRSVALDPGIVIPVGTFTDSNGVQRDIREIDLPYVIKHGNSELVNKWIMSDIYKACDNFATKVEVLGQLGLVDATITGKAVRIPINPNFFSELVSKLTAVGYNPIVESAGIQITQFQDLYNMAANYATVGLGNANFGQAMYGQQMQNPYVFNNYGGMGGF